MSVTIQINNTDRLEASIDGKHWVVIIDFAELNKPFDSFDEAVSQPYFYSYFRLRQFRPGESSTVPE